MLYISGRPAAVARLSGGTEAPLVRGTVRFYQRPDGVLVVAQVSGLPASPSGFHGFHIHEGVSCGGEQFANSGSHFNPTNTSHPMHAGDLPPLYSCNGRAYLAVMTDRFSIADILGRTVIIHSDPDDFHTQPSGNAGNKIACGIIFRA